MRIRNPIELTAEEKAKLENALPTVAIKWGLGSRIVKAAKATFEEVVPTIEVKRRKR